MPAVRAPARALRVPLAAWRRRRWRAVRDARKDFLQLARDYTPYVATEVEGTLLLVATDDPTLESIFQREKRKEESVLLKALDYLEAAGVELARTTFVDVGANIGTATLAALSAGFSSVLAVEPGPAAFRLLRANLALNGVESSVQTLQVALSDHRGVARLDLDRGSRKGRLLQRPGAHGHRRSEEVQLTRLDDLVADGVLDAQVGMLWMDVEGHECHVLQGGQRVLEHAPPLVMELNPPHLREAGTIDRLPDVLEQHYTHFVDLRDKSDRAELAPIGELRPLVTSFEERRHSSDILVCRDVR